jgi:N-acetylglucosamine-6-phosphate deacetylase
MFEGLVLVTDAIAALGVQEGTHQLGQMAIEVRGGRALVAGTETLCGSNANMNQCKVILKCIIQK